MRHRLTLFVPIALSAVIVVGLAFTAANFIQARWIMPQDYTRFWYVGAHLLLAHASALTPVSHAALNAMHPIDLLSPSAGLQVWLYPPTLNVLAMIFAVLPLRQSYIAWDICSLLAATRLLRWAGLSWPAITLGLCASSDFFNLAGGQTGTLLGALLVACLLMADTHPRLAGLCAAGLSLKPQIGLALIAIAPQRLRLLVAAGLGTAVIVAISVWWQGAGQWLWFFNVGAPSAMRFICFPWRATVPEWSVSCLIMVRSFGLGLAQAWVIQAAVAVAALLMVAAAWRFRSADPHRRMAFTVSLSVLIMPYGFLYDMTAFGIAMAVMMLNAPAAMRPVFALLWLASGFSSECVAWFGHPLFPLVAAAAAFACRPPGLFNAGPAPVTARSEQATPAARRRDGFDL